MKIRNIYLGKGIPFFCIAMTLLCITVTLISQLIPSTYMAFRFVYPMKYPWQAVSYIFLQGIPKDLLPADYPYTSMQLTLGHLGYNLLLVIPFGVLAEKIIGTKKMLILFGTTCILDLIANLIMGAIYTKDGDMFSVAGASGIAFAFMPVGMYALFLFGKNFGFGKLFKQVSFYVLMGMAIPTAIISLTPRIGDVAGVPSMVIHLMGLIIGSVFAIVYRKSLQDYFYKEKPSKEQGFVNTPQTV